MDDKIEYYEYKKADMIDKPLWYHKQGLQQTATGYGSKLTTSKMLKIGKRLHRVYYICYSNSGSCYIIKNGQRLFIRDYAIDE
jgi:hypothetical protein